MALVRFSNLVNDIRGASGGNQFSRCKAGAMVSARHHKRKVRRSVYSNVVNPTPYLAGAWRNLSEDQRDSWSAGVSMVHRTNRLGFIRKATGFELFVQANFHRTQFGFPLISEFSFYQGSFGNSIESAQYRISDNRVIHIGFSGSANAQATVSYVSRVSMANVYAIRGSVPIMVTVAANPIVNNPAYSSSTVGTLSGASPLTVGGYFHLKYVSFRDDVAFPIQINKLLVQVIA